jgi:hypothetical protein
MTTIYTVFRVRRFEDDSDDVDIVNSYMREEDAKNAIAQLKAEKEHNNEGLYPAYLKWEDAKSNVFTDYIRNRFPVRNCPNPPKLRDIPDIIFNIIPPDRHEAIRTRIKSIIETNESLLEAYNNKVNSYSEYLRFINNKIEHKRIKDETVAKWVVDNPPPAKIEYIDWDYYYEENPLVGDIP